MSCPRPQPAAEGFGGADATEKQKNNRSSLLLIYLACTLYSLISAKQHHTSNEDLTHYFPGAGPATFLSRLCGGQQISITVPYASAFLSRLCGGQLEACRRAAGNTFLSRLCGGQHQGQHWAGPYQFLSRLCGGQL